MKDPIKITIEESQILSGLQTEFRQLIEDFGNLSIEKLQVEDALKSVTKKDEFLQNQYKQLQNKENETIQSLNKKYGDGVLDIKQGLFIPNE